MTREEFDKFEHESYEYLKGQQEILQAEYGTGRYERWDWEQETGEFIFSDQGVPKLVADFQIVGSISTFSNTWLWSWANPSILENVRKDIHKVREFGEQNGLVELIEEKWPADELDGWAMTNVTARLLQAKGAYRCPDDNGATFIIFTSVRKVRHA